jgi:hypothetical protein
MFILPKPNSTSNNGSIFFGSKHKGDKTPCHKKEPKRIKRE